MTVRHHDDRGLTSRRCAAGGCGSSGSVSSALDAGRCCLVITGPPAAGKSSVARLVAARLSRAAHLDGDVVNELIVSGRVWALGEPADEAALQVRLCNENLCSLAANFTDAGFTPIIDWVVPDRQQLDSYIRSETWAGGSTRQP